jgi:putative salt-induced outer membrane protein YdiY
MFSRNLLSVRMLRSFLGCLLLLLGAVAPSLARDVVVQLRNGDRLTGRLLGQETNSVILATSWAESLVIPLAAIGGLRAATGEDLLPPPDSTVATAKTDPAETPKSPATAATAADTKPTPQDAPKRFRHNVQAGANFNFGARDSQLFYGRIKSTYERPYDDHPKLFFRTFGDYSVDYGRTEKLVSADRMSGSLKTDFDLTPRYYAYNAASCGYDDVRRIDFQYEAGPGLGVRVLTHTNLSVSLESGLNYQAQQRADNADVDSLYWRIGNNLTWKISPRLTLAEKFEFFLDGADPEQYRFRLDATLSLRVLENISLNLTVLNTFDTDPAASVNKNELQIRSSIGVAF